MTPQQKAPSKDLGSWIQEGGKKMKASVQRRRSSSAIGRALSKNKAHSRQITLVPSHCGGSLLLGSFCSPNNMFILKERVHLSSGSHTQERHLFLFSDSLIITKSKSSSSMKLKKQVRLSEVWISTSLWDVSERRHSTDDSFVIGWPTTNYVVTFSSSDTKEKWLSTLSWHITEVKKDEFPGKIAISVLYLDADEYTSSTTVTVSNMDPAEKVIKVVSQQLELPGRQSDYHLWVTSGKDEPPYPLFGHEYPYSIAMNCLQESVVMARGLNNNHSPEHSADGILEQIPHERQCQFIVKLRPQGAVDVRRESAQKQRRRKKSLIDWALRRSGSATLSTPSSQSPLTPRKLFGHSLSSVCPNGNLPKPIMDMLLLLYEEGPTTRGIFRRSANAKTCKELKEKLLSGDDVQIDGESVFVAAAVITDFLRNLPDSILSSDMYGLWMEVPEFEQPKKRIKVIKSLLDQLPEANFNLLQHLFAVLNHIGKNSEENQMTALNLALCIAPNMLWLPTGGDPEEESKSTKKVAGLVQFIIENYSLIFEQDASLLFNKHRQQESGSTDDLADIHMIHRQDSSDELEFAASDLDKSESSLLKDEDGLFDESLLLEEREDWDLFSEISACYLNKTKMDCTDSTCCLSPCRDRCSSEPSVCHSSRLELPPNHEPVARQSSCDATIIHSHLDYINQMKQLQLESQNLLNEDAAPSTKNTQCGFWRSTQMKTNPKEKSSHTVNPSKRSSISSLSSTTTSPSASSLSSLDSAFSYCSESPVFNSSDVTSLPFMFGTSARLHTLSPEITKKKLREWHIPLSTLFGTSSCDLESWEMQWESKEQNHIKEKEKGTNVFPVQGSVHASLERESSQPLSSSGKEGVTYMQKPKFKISRVKTESVSENGNCVHKEISVRKIEMKKAESLKDERPQQAKVAFYASPNIMSITNLNDQNLNEDSCSRSCQVTKLKIPQTVFYGQNTPLVLHSVSRKQHPELEKPQWQTQLKHIVRRSSAGDMVTNNGDLSSAFTDKEVITKEEHEEPQSTKESQLAKSHTNTITTFSQTIRVSLPSSVKNTVREYFKHGDPKPSPYHEAAVANNVVQEKTENLQGAKDHLGT
ncbi:PREDICTED: rho GTPase-activating protein 20-like [Nanorana parkeri]|uniref:rho GTPase-activating protein 20-like n=1 Tax=Nanorana parkeri TaxID=125878 RepID=UPI000854A89B|nr:PREDICTED: rho GTPase-activating protein 20-like [Nanorana parkeri]